MAEGRTYRRQSAEERRGERRARLIAAAVEAFGNDPGYAATSIEALCARAGVSTRNFYEEFAGREELVVYLHDDLNARALTAVVAALADVDLDDVPARADAAMRAYLDVMTSDRRWARIATVESVGISATAEEHRRSAIGRFVTLLSAEAARLAGDGIIERRDYRLTAVAIAGAINGLVSDLDGDEEDWQAQVDAVHAEATRMIVRSMA